ncbi:MAG: 4Fe-4S binding protein, partial [Nitrospirae bacterium]
DVDAVSRATVSEEALCRAISISTKKVAREVFGLEIKEEGRTSKALSIKPLVFSAWFVFVVVYYLLTKRNKGLLRFRNLILLGSVLIMGVYLSTFFSIIHFIQILRGEISFRWQWLMVVLFTAVSFLVLGRFYCGWLCPFGAINELTGQKLPQWNPSGGYDLRLRGLKYLVLIVLTGGVCFGLRAVHIDFEPYLTLFSFRGNLFTWAIVIITIVAGLKLPRPWCRYLCPVGALSGLFERPQKGYMGMKGCPVGLTEYVSGECIRCNRCYQKR